MTNKNLKEDIIEPLINNLKMRMQGDEQKNFDGIEISKDEDSTKKFLKLLLCSCIDHPAELFNSYKKLIENNINDNDLANFIHFCYLNIAAQYEAYGMTLKESTTIKQRYNYLTQLYETSKKDIQDLSKVHSPANNLEEIEFNKAKRTDKIERTFQQMVNDMVYLVDFLNRSLPSQYKSKASHQ